MSITTKIGDRKTSRLLSGEEVAKDNVRLETYGTLDELVAHLGMARSLLKDSPVAKEIRNLQVDLFRVGAELSCTDPSKNKWAEPTTKTHVEILEGKMKALESQIKLPRSFLVPGTTPASAALEVARTVSRRLERRAVELSKRGEYANDQGLIYLNRLSDYCFLLARTVEKEAGIPFDAKDR
ncbi:MAG: cob(I)yrinic acid a,c-diamide adenosyltransferase [Deltaproteobacteria bacterium]|nr:cob(I)yrinic acid a,c-diamide adenosyltransferase [Deltaproteobacteria bacterium]